MNHVPNSLIDELLVGIFRMSGWLYLGLLKARNFLKTAGCGLLDLRAKTRGRRPQETAISAEEMPRRIGLIFRMRIHTFSCAVPGLTATEGRKFGA